MRSSTDRSRAPAHPRILDHGPVLARAERGAILGALFLSACTTLWQRARRGLRPLLRPARARANRT